MDKRPIRRKHRDNPYELESGNNTYFVKFIDNKKVYRIVEVSAKVYEAFDMFELDDISQMHEYERHIEHSELFESTLTSKAVNKEISIEDQVEEKLKNEELYKAISVLSDVQKRRIKMYYFENKTLKEIVEIEECSAKNVLKSIELAKSKIKENLKN